MSEEILKALMQLFAITTKQDEGVTQTQQTYVENFLKLQLNQSAVDEYLKLYRDFAGLNEQEGETKKKKKLTSVGDSVKILVLCKKINKTLTQKQKIIVAIRLLELIYTDGKFSEQEMEIVNTTVDVFNISLEELEIIKTFVFNFDREKLNLPDVLLIDGKDTTEQLTAKHIHSDIDGCISILRVKSVDMYFIKYFGNSNIVLNGLTLNNRQIYLFAYGSTIKPPIGRPVYYNDVANKFLFDAVETHLSFEAKNLHYTFPNGNIGLRDVNISEGSGQLIALMGASGAGKTTLLNVLSGIEKPTKGEILINGINIHTDKSKIEGVIGFVAQDDLLIEELTVFQNLFYNAKLCFKHLDEQKITELVDKTLNNLGLLHIKDLKVGNPLNKKISGGQRKRLNIALELIREPTVMFLDEPTSGLSSRDSENILDLLRELTLKGKLIFVVIHQPSSDIYKMFDKVLILDVGGYSIYYGNPVEAVMYFKRISNQINSDIGQCQECGNVNPELIFNIIDSKVVDEYGKFTELRKFEPTQLNTMFKENFPAGNVKQSTELPEKTLNIPSKIKQWLIFVTRDTLSKIGNTQYMLINFLEAPSLAFILAFIIRYIDNPKEPKYVFGDNENIYAYILMCIIVALFMGLMVSAEEIIRDRKILKREAFLNLSKTSYLFSKVVMLFTLSAVQTISFVIVGNLILGIHDMVVPYWLMLFSVSCFANMLGLNISNSFNSAVTVYILIPILLIPQMILSGAIFSFDKLNRVIGSRDKVPLIADMMASRWAFEGLIVNQFINNKFEKQFYDLEKKLSIGDYKQAYYFPELLYKVNECERLLNAEEQNDSTKKIIKYNLGLLKREIAKEVSMNKKFRFKLLDRLNPDDFNMNVLNFTKKWLTKVMNDYSDQFNYTTNQRDNMVYFMQVTPEKEKNFRQMQGMYFNENLEDLAKKTNTKYKIVEEHGRLIQQLDPIFLDPYPTHPLDYRAHFFAPQKHFAGKFYSTYDFNITIIWLMSIVLYLTLYFELFKKMMDVFESKAFKKMILFLKFREKIKKVVAPTEI